MPVNFWCNILVVFVAGKLIENRRHVEAACLLADYANVCTSCVFCGCWIVFHLYNLPVIDGREVTFVWGKRWKIIRTVTCFISYLHNAYCVSYADLTFQPAFCVCCEVTRLHNLYLYCVVHLGLRGGNRHVSLWQWMGWSSETGRVLCIVVWSITLWLFVVVSVFVVNPLIAQWYCT